MFIDIKIPFFRLLVTTEQHHSTPYLHFVTTNCLNRISKKNMSMQNRQNIQKNKSG